MVSQISNVDSVGHAIDHEGNSLEEDSAFLGLPLLGPLNLLGNPAFGENAPCEESNMLDAPMEIFVEDNSAALGAEAEQPLENSPRASDGMLSPGVAIDAARAAENSQLFKAAFQINSNERERAILASKRVLDLQAFITSKGFSLSEVNEFLQVAGGYSPSRDDAGLPTLHGFSKSVIGAKATSNESDAENNKSQTLMQMLSPVFKKGFGLKDLKTFILNEEKKLIDVAQAKGSNGSNTPPVVSSPVEDIGQPPQNSGKPSWSNVVKQSSSCNELLLDYCPMPANSPIVCPPDAVLKKGIEKFKNCIIGTFSKGTLSLKKVIDIAEKAWLQRGLQQTSQKGHGQFLFRFSSQADMNYVLARGTWYFDNKPMLVQAWGSSVSSGAAKTMPLWVNFGNIPDYYWTKEGLSFIASAIGRPLSVDQLTAKLNPIPFAKICVNYNIGDPMPDSITVAGFDPCTEEKSPITIDVSYPQKPLVCQGCHSLGHSVGACPSTRRTWVKKSATSAQGTNAETSSSPEKGGVAVSGTPEQRKDKNAGDWTTINRKGKNQALSVCTSSAADLTEEVLTPTISLKNPENVGEIEFNHKDQPTPSGMVIALDIVADQSTTRGLTRNQRKRRKRSGGKVSPSSHS